MTERGSGRNVRSPFSDLYQLWEIHTASVSPVSSS